jgi:hypothetical protein
MNKKQNCPWCGEGTWNGEVCLSCGAKEERLERELDSFDEAYERAASRDRLDDFARTGGKDWT